MESCRPAKANPQPQPGRQKGSFSLILVHCECPGRETEGLRVLLSLLPCSPLERSGLFQVGSFKKQMKWGPQPPPSPSVFSVTEETCPESPVHFLPIAPSQGSHPSWHQKRGLGIPCPVGAWLPVLWVPSGSALLNNSCGLGCVAFVGGL